MSVRRRLVSLPARIQCARQVTEAKAMSSSTEGKDPVPARSSASAAAARGDRKPGRRGSKRVAGARSLGTQARAACGRSRPAVRGCPASWRAPPRCSAPPSPAPPPRSYRPSNSIPPPSRLQTPPNLSPRSGSGSRTKLRRGGGLPGSAGFVDGVPADSYHECLPGDRSGAANEEGSETMRVTRWAGRGLAAAVVGVLATFGAAQGRRRRKASPAARWWRRFPPIRAVSIRRAGRAACRTW